MNHSLESFIHEPRIAYFSMEIALRSEIPTYSGGLGVLAGDTLRSAADLGIPLVGVTLVSREGYFHQSIDPTRRQWSTPTRGSPRPAESRCIGGVRMLDALGFHILAYHLNEGHSALLTLQLLQRAE